MTTVDLPYTPARQETHGILWFGARCEATPNCYGLGSCPSGRSTRMNVAATFRKNTARGSLIRTSAGRYSPAYNAGVQIYTGEHEFVDTTMLLKVDHEIAPKEQALGKNLCDDCHLAGQIDWQGLGWTGNPVSGGTRQTAAR